MKRIIIVLSMLAGIPAWSQAQPSQKRLENHIMIGAGLFEETGNRASNVFPGAVLRLSYGLDVKIGDKWSLMPGAGIRAQLGEVNHIGWVGGDPDGMSMADLFCQARYHLISEETKMVIGLRNMLRQYPEYSVSGSVHLHNIMFICGWRF